MAKPQPTSAPTEDLDSRVDALLKDISTDAEGMEKALEPASGSPNVPAPPPREPSSAGGGPGALRAIDDLDKQIQDLLAMQPAGAAASPIPSSVPDGAGAKSPPAPVSGAAPKQAPLAPASAEADDIGALDKDLARLTETLLSGNDPLPEPGPGRGVPSAATATAPTLPHADASSGQFVEPAVKTTDAAPVAGADQNAGAPESARARALRATVPGVARLGGSVGRAAGPAFLSVMAAASAPLGSRPKIVRDTVGWIALWTAFLSLSLWTYLLFFHKPEVPRTDRAPIQIVGHSGTSRGEKGAPGDGDSQDRSHPVETTGGH